MPEYNFFLQKSTLSIFRYEEVMFSVYPHLATLKRRGQTTKEIFANLDPNRAGSTQSASEMQRKEGLGSGLEAVSEVKDVESSKFTLFCHLPSFCRAWNGLCSEAAGSGQGRSQQVQS